MQMLFISPKLKFSLVLYSTVYSFRFFSGPIACCFVQPLLLFFSFGAMALERLLDFLAKDVNLVQVDVRIFIKKVVFVVRIVV